MQHNDIRRALCSDCKLFVIGPDKHTYRCAFDGSTLRVGKHKLPLKNQSCRGPYDYIPIDELMNVTEEQRAQLLEALDKGTIDKNPGTTRYIHEP